MSGFSKPTREVGARLSHSAAQAVATATPTVLSLDGTVRAAGMTVGTNKLTALEAGWYVISGHAAFAANATGLRAISIKLNGTTTIASQHMISGGAVNTANLSICTNYYLAVGDFVQIEAYQESGVSLNVQSLASYSPALSAMKLPGAP